jgi:hypothetical protein
MVCLWFAISGFVLITPLTVLLGEANGGHAGLYPMKTGTIPGLAAQIMDDKMSPLGYR